MCMCVHVRLTDHKLALERIETRDVRKLPFVEITALPYYMMAIVPEGWVSAGCWIYSFCQILRDSNGKRERKQPLCN